MQKTSKTFYMLINLKIVQFIMKYSFFLFLQEFKQFREMQVSKFRLIFFFNLLIQTFFIYISRLFREHCPYSYCKFSFFFLFVAMAIIPVNFVVNIVCNVIVSFDSLVWDYFQRFHKLFHQQLWLEIMKIFRIMRRKIISEM